MGEEGGNSIITFFIVLSDLNLLSSYYTDIQLAPAPLKYVYKMETYEETNST